MTNQIEEIKRQAELAAERMENMSVGEQGINELYRGAEALIAANELLQQVVVLEEGAEPMVGDLMQDNVGTLLRCLSRPNAEMVGYKALASGVEGSRGINSGIKIVQRQGKPVIYQQGTK